MPKVNGNDGNNNDLMKGLQAYYEALRAKASGNTNKSAEVKNDVPVGKQNGVHNTKMGDDLLKSANFYAGMGLNLNKTQKPKPGSLEDLQQKQDMVLSGNVSQEDVTETLAIIDAIPTINKNEKVYIGLDTLATYREYPTRFGKLQTPEEGSEEKATKDAMLYNLDILESITSFA